MDVKELFLRTPMKKELKSFKQLIENSTKKKNFDYDMKDLKILNKSSPKLKI